MYMSNEKEGIQIKGVETIMLNVISWDRIIECIREFRNDGVV